ncbi:MAG: colicin V production CvpA, partial [Treponema sp. GWB1_62_6]
RCALRGFIEEFMSMAAVVFGALCAVLLFKPGAVLVEKNFKLPVPPELVAFVALFLIAFIVVKILEKILADIIDRVNMESLDRLLGALFGLAEGLLVVSVFLFILSIQPLFDSAPLLKGSLFARYLLPLVTEAGRTAVHAATGK